jgi:hypothetical protein
MIKASQLHKGDIVSFSYLQGIITEINKKDNSLLVRVDALGEQPCRIDISMVDEIISYKTIYVVNMYYYKDDEVKSYQFNTEKEARTFIQENTNKGEDDYTLTKRDRDTNEILEDIIL